MKKFTVLILLLSIYFALTAKQIDEITAKQLGKNFLISQLNMSYSSIDLSLVYKAEQNNSLLKDKSSSNKYFYIFNFKNKKGFIIVSADDIVIPVLGYSLNNSFVLNNIPSNINWCLQNYCDQIQSAIERNILSTKENKAEWKSLLSGNNKKNNKSISSLNPLLQTTWNQYPYYNDLCPYDNTYSELTVTGCVATAMAQIMKYWNYPVNGTGTTPAYTTITNSFNIPSVNISSITYNWTAMPDNVTSSNYDVANLMYDCGISVEMDYGVADVGGSSAEVLDIYSPICAENALKNYFGYSNSLQGILKSSYPESQWINLMENELNNNRPIIYTGRGPEGGHCFVIDGYDNSNYFHLNWGWAGVDDGYFSIDALDPGTDTFDDNQGAIIGITPPSSQCNYTLSQNTNNFSSNGGTGSFNVYTSTNCSWTAISNNPTWLLINTSSSNGTGNGTINYSINPNNNINTLYGSITVAGLTYKITETGLSCTYDLNPTASNTYSSSGGYGSFSVSTNSSCEWSVISNDPSWLHITSFSSGSGNSTISYSVDTNSSTNTLTGTISVAEQTYTVTETGASIDCSVTIIPSNNSVIGNHQGSYSFVFDINPNCSYSTLSSSPEWLTISSATNNVVYYYASKNQSYFPRTGFIYINDVYKMITQDGNTTLGIEDLSQLNNVNIYPNPSNEKIIVEFVATNDIKDEMISIYNLEGQLIIQMPMQQQKMEININEFAKGVYIVKLSNDDNIIIKKFVKD